MVNSTQAVLRTHPDSIWSGSLPTLTACVEACFRCTQTCTACADACLAEPFASELIQCIRCCLDCADVCAATGRVVARQTLPSRDLMRAQLQSSITACRVCYNESVWHASLRTHCRVCALVCQSCEATCQRLLDLIPA